MSISYEYAAEVSGPLMKHLYGPLPEADAYQLVRTTLGGGIVLRRELPGDRWEIGDTREPWNQWIGQPTQWTGQPT